MILASEARGAARLAASMAGALVPPDLSLLVQNQWLLVDFSTRPFDPIELERMRTLIEQLAARM